MCRRPIALTIVLIAVLVVGIGAGTSVAAADDDKLCEPGSPNPACKEKAAASPSTVAEGLSATAPTTPAPDVVVEDIPAVVPNAPAAVMPADALRWNTHGPASPSTTFVAEKTRKSSSCGPMFLLKWLAVGDLGMYAMVSLFTSLPINFQRRVVLSLPMTMLRLMSQEMVKRTVGTVSKNFALILNAVHAMRGTSGDRNIVEAIRKMPDDKFRLVIGSVAGKFGMIPYVIRCIFGFNSKN